MEINLTEKKFGSEKFEEKKTCRVLISKILLHGSCIYNFYLDCIDSERIYLSIKIITL